jgi:hypothetical protein
LVRTPLDICYNIFLNFFAGRKRNKAGLFLLSQ